MNSIPFTEKLTHMSKINVPTIVEQALRNDMAKTLDSAAWLAFSATSWKAVCTTTAVTSITTNTTGSGTCLANCSDKNFRDIIDALKKGLVPTRANGRYQAIFNTNSMRGLYDYFEPKANFTTLAVADNGLVGTYYGYEESSMALLEAA